MTVGELIDKLGEMPADTPVWHVDPIDGLTSAANDCEYDEERGIAVLS